MPVTHDALVARLGLKIRISLKKVSDFRLDSLRQQRMRSVAQNLSERIAESPWLSELDHVSVGHGVSLLWWRSGGVKHLHDTPPHPFMPSPTSAHSSSWLSWEAVLTTCVRLLDKPARHIDGRQLCFPPKGSCLQCQIGANGQNT